MGRTKTPAALLKRLKAEGLVAERTLVEAVAGEAVHGSWWGHKSGHAIYRALQALQEESDVFVCKLLDGKQTYVHRRLWPALLRLQAEAPLWPRLSPEGRRLLQQVRERGAVGATGKVRLELERTLRVVAHSGHTPSGAHRVVLRPFEAHFSSAEVAAAARLSLAEAQAALGLLPLLKAATARRRPGPTAGRPRGQSTPSPGALPPQTSPRASRIAPPSARRRPQRR